MRRQLRAVRDRRQRHGGRRVGRRLAGRDVRVVPAGGRRVGHARAGRPTTRNYDVAMSTTGDAVAALPGRYPGYAFSKYRPAGGDLGRRGRGDREQLPGHDAGADGRVRRAGRTVALATFREFMDTVRVNVRTGGGWGPTDQVARRRRRSTHDPLFDLRDLVGARAAPAGAVAVWTRRSTSTNFNDDIVVSRLTRPAGTRRRSSTRRTATRNASVATNAPGEILVAAALNHGARRAASTTSTPRSRPRSPARGPRMTRISPAGTTPNIYRDAHRGRRRLGVLRRLGRARRRATSGPRSSRRSRPGRARTPSPTPTPTPTATRRRRRPDAAATADPLPRLPRRRRRPPSGPPDDPAARRPRAIADFTTLPAASKCVSGRKLTLRFKRPPKGYTVKTVTVKVNAQAAWRRSRAPSSRSRSTCASCRRGTFTVTVSIKLTKGKGLTERRRYTACK